MVGPPDQRLQDQVAVVTGATSGIGFAVAKRFAAEGARVVITGRRPEALGAAVAELGPGAHGVRADALKLEDLDRLFAEVTETAPMTFVIDNR